MAGVHHPAVVFASGIAYCSTLQPGGQVFMCDGIPDRPTLAIAPARSHKPCGGMTAVPDAAIQRLVPCC